MMSKLTLPGEYGTLKRDREHSIDAKKVSKSNKPQSLDDMVAPKTSVMYYMCTRLCPQLVHGDYIKTISTFCVDGAHYDIIVCCLCGHCHSDCDSTFVFSLSINALKKELTEFLCLILGSERTDGYDFDYLDIDMRELQPFLKYIDFKDELLMYEQAFMHYNRISVTTRASCHGTLPYCVLKRVAGNVSKGYSVHDCPPNLHDKMMMYVIRSDVPNDWCKHTIQNTDIIRKCGGKHGIVELLDMLKLLDGVVDGAFAAAVAQKDNETAQQMLLPSDMIEVSLFKNTPEHIKCDLLTKWAIKYNYKSFSDVNNSYVLLHEHSRTVRITYKHERNLPTDINYFHVEMNSSRTIKLDSCALADWTDRTLSFRSDVSSRPYLAFLLDVHTRSHDEDGELQKWFNTQYNPYHEELLSSFTTQQIETSSNRLRHHYPLHSDNNDFLFKEYGLTVVRKGQIRVPTRRSYHNQRHYLTSNDPREYTFQKEINLYPFNSYPFNEDNMRRFDERRASVSFAGKLVKMTRHGIQFRVDDDKRMEEFRQALQSPDKEFCDNIWTARMTPHTVLFVNGARTPLDLMSNALHNYEGQIDIAINETFGEYCEFDAMSLHVQLAGGELRSTIKG
jgi:hypothetical protein